MAVSVVGRSMKREDDLSSMETADSVGTLLRRYGGLILLVAANVVLAAILIPLLQSPVYTSTATIAVLPQLSGSGVPQQPDMGTEREIALSGNVAAIAADDLGLAVSDAADGLSVSVPIETTVLKMQYVNSKPREAQRRAAAFANAYSRYRTTAYSSGRPVPPTSGAQGDAAAPANVTAQVITAPTLPRSPTRPDYPLRVGIGLVLGLGLGLAVALAWDRARGRATQSRP
jgi:capsular polysaccharide biosynthesis protein